MFQSEEVAEDKTLPLGQKIVVQMKAFISGELFPNVDSEVVSEPVVQMENVTDVKAVEAEFTAELEEEVWVVPE